MLSSAETRQSLFAATFAFIASLFPLILTYYTLKRSKAPFSKEI